MRSQNPTRTKQAQAEPITAKFSCAYLQHSPAATAANDMHDTHKHECKAHTCTQHVLPHNTKRTFPTYTTQHTVAHSSQLLVS